MGKRLSSIFIVAIMILTSFVGMIQTVEAEFPDVITTYRSNVTPATEFNNGSIVVVNITVDKCSGDPGGGNFYWIKARNTATHEWIKVNVTDNQNISGLPPNVPNDHHYWSKFQINGSHASHNSSGPGNLAILHVHNHETVNISEVYPGPFDNDSYVANKTIHANYTSGPPPSEYYFIAGQIKDRITHAVVPNASVMVYYNGYVEGFFNNGPYPVNGTTGNFSINVSAAGLGYYTVQIFCDEYVGYINWSIQIEEAGIKNLGVISLEPYFETHHQQNSYIRGNVIAAGNPVLGAQIMLLDTNFNHIPGGGQGENTTIETDENGNYSFNIQYRSIYKIIAFTDGYYADLSDNIIINNPHQTKWKNFSLQRAAPDTLHVTVHFTDLDDATITINRTVVAASRVFRFSLDVDPSLGGDNNQNVSQAEVTAYLGMLGKDGPGFKSFGEDNGGGKGKEGGQGPTFLEIPINVLLDGSGLDDYVAGSHSGHFDNLINTTVSSNQTIYYNATFRITLDGLILNRTSHPLNITTVFNSTTAVNITFLFNSLYNFTAINSTNVNSYLSHTTSMLIVAPGSGNPEIPAYANVTITFNGSKVKLPIFEVPTWNIGDRWSFTQKVGSHPSGVTYTMNGKPLQQWDQEWYRIGDGDNSYISYELLKGQHEYVYVTMSDLAWLNTTDKIINYIVNDVDFPLYRGKTWNTKSWWNETVTATVNSSTDAKTTANGTYSCIKISYRNTTQIVGREWYSPRLKFFVNRTRYINHQVNSTLNLMNYSHAPYIESMSITPWEDPADADTLINTLNATLMINTSQFYDGPTDYVFQGALEKRNQNGPSNKIAFLWNDSGLRHLVRGSGIKSITLPYSGTLINASGIDGPYTIWLELREQQQNGPGRTIDYIETETDPYSHLDFQSPAVSILAIHDAGNDTDENGLYDYLTENITLHVLKAGNYSMNGGLNYVNGWEQRWITGAGTGRRYLHPGEITIQLNFDGTDIYEQGYNSPYICNIELWDDDSHTMVVQNESEVTGTYLYTYFETPSIYFNRTWMAQSAMHDYINGSTYLTVNTSIFVAAGTFSGGTGIYDLHCGLEYTSGGFVTGTGGQITLHEGNNMVPVNFNIDDIYQRNSSYHGTFTMYLGFSQWTGGWSPDIDNSQYVTKEYNLSNPQSFPRPPITLQIVNDSITHNGDYLTIYAWINISSASFAGVDLDLHGGVHWIEHKNGWDDWHFITGTGGTVSYSVGNHSITVNFSGTEIRASGQSGQYKIFLGLDSLPAHNRITSVEYTTHTYSPGNFSAPGVMFAAGTNDFKNGTDYLTIRVHLIVTTPGTYRIGGGINWLQRMNGWDNWVFITGTGGEYTLNENTTLDLNFDQGMIRNALQTHGYSGVLQAFINVEKSGNMQQITHLDYTTNPYSASNFSSAAVNIISATPTISNGDLKVNITYNATRGGSYTINGGVHTQNWNFITGTWSQPTLTLGTHSINIIFDGRQIYSSMQNGPYKIWLGIENVSTHRLIANTELTTSSSWHYTNFTAPEIRIIREDMGEGTADYMNTSGTGTYLTVNVSLSTSSPGRYRLDGGLNYIDSHNQWQWLTGTGKDIVLNSGETIVSLNFNAGDIYSKGKDGPYKIWIGVRNTTTWQDIDRYEYTTQFYNHSHLPPPPVQFGAMTEGSTLCGYINGSSFTVNVTLNVQAGYAGTYDLHGDVAYRTTEGWWQHITGTGNRIALVTGTNHKVLNFNAGEIRTGLPGGYNNNLTVWIGINNVSTWTETSHIEYITKKYQQNNFPPSGITIAATGDYVNGSNLTINITATVQAGYNGVYDVHGSLNWIDNSEGFERWMFITGAGSPQYLATGTNHLTLNFNGGDIYTTLFQQGYTGKLTAWIGVQNRTTWQTLAHIDYRTPTDYSKASFHPPSLSINCTGDFNNAHQYLTVNVTVNATGDSLNHPYDIHAGLNWKENGQWQFITGYGMRIENLSSNMTIPLNFTGAAIRSARHNGTYEVWVGISTPGNWQDLAHKQYTTTKTYHYDAFAPPVVQINGLTDYNNNKNLTINVTVNVNRTGTYSLEGVLHWKTGFEWRFFTWEGDTIALTSGTHTIPLTFDGMQITRAAQDTGWPGGTTLVAWIAVRNTTTGAEIDRVNEYTTTHIYSRGDFVVAPVTFNRTATITYQPYRDGGLKNISLNVTVPLNITGSPTSTYTIYADLYKNGTNSLITTTSANISTLSHQVNISFNGTRINDKHYNGTFEFRARIIDTGHSFECDRITKITGIYHYTDFKELPPEATIIGSYSNYTNGAHLFINITINVNTTHRQYEVYGDLFDNTSTVYVTHAKNVTYFNTTGHVVVHLVFDREKINASGIAAPYNLAYLRLSIKKAGDSWEVLETKINPYTYITGGA